MTTTRKYSLWILVGFLTFLLGLLAFYLFWSAPRSEVVNIDTVPPIVTCECADSPRFPGRSILVDRLNARERSIFDDKRFARAPDDRFYSAFKEERSDKSLFEDGMPDPETAQADEIYRFFWLRTFHNPYSFRIFRTGNEKFLVVKKTDGHGGYDPGSLVVNKTLKLSDQQWCNFLDLLDEADFWSKKKLNISNLAQDGSFWTIEGIRERRYSVAGEQSPIGGKFRDACIYLMRISGEHIDENAQEFY